MRLRATTALAAVLLCLAPAASRADLASYTQNFEALVQADPAALANDNWKVFGNVFTPTFGYLYGYGVFPAPNGTPGFCSVAAGQGGPTQGAQQIVVYSDYNNGDHANGNLIEANVFQEQTVGAANVGQAWIFSFDAKLGDLVPPTTALAFIKTLNPAAGYATTNFLTLATHTLPTTWGTYSIAINIDASLVGQILQFGFASTATNYTPSGVLYDNISFQQDTPVSTRSTTWGRMKALYR
uniref:Uncharacterized protein n=1 Tax=Eiseniibacteriota bacterium TaxID=2212470 RepID=A0A832I489_UNCEI